MNKFLGIVVIGLCGIN